MVDDGSIDDTAVIAKREGALVIRNEKNMGKGAALRAGFGQAFKDGYEAVLTMDGDDQHDVTDIAQLIKKMREKPDAGMIIGNRMLDTGSMPRLRIAVNKFTSRLMSWVARQYVPDSQCGFRIVKKDVYDRIKLESSNFEIESEMIIKAARAGFRIESAPIKTVYQDEKSRINPIVDTLRFIAMMVRMALKR